MCEGRGWGGLGPGARDQGGVPVLGIGVCVCEGCSDMPVARCGGCGGGGGAAACSDLGAKPRHPPPGIHTAQAVEMRG